MRISGVATLNLKVAIGLSYIYVIIASYFRLSSGSQQMTECSHYHGINVLRELNPPKHFARFFLPDCDKRKVIFQPHKQGCLGALRWLEEFVGPNKTFGKLKTPFFKRIACSHKTCKDLPPFRKCGSNQPNKSNPRSFRNGCRQCAASCKEVVAGRRRYVRLGNEKCLKLHKGGTTLFQKPPPNRQMFTPPTENDSIRDKVTDSSTTDIKINRVTTVPTSTAESTLEPTTTAQTTAADSTLKLTTKGVTTMVVTTDLTTTEASCDDEKLPIRTPPSTVYCTSPKVKDKINCSLIKDFENDLNNLKLPRLPAWQPKETNDG